MPVLDFILPAANRVVSSDNDPSPSFAANTATGESFDHVMTRALSPAETDGAAGSDRPDAVPTVSGQARQNIIFTPGQRHFVSTRNIVSEKTAAAAGETGDSATPPAGPSRAPAADRTAKISAQDHGAVATAATDQNAPPMATGGLPGVVIMGPVTAVLPISVPPPSSSAAQKPGAADTAARSTASPSPRATTAAELDIPKIPAAHSQTETGDSAAGTNVNQESFSNQPGEAFIPVPTSAGRQKNAVEAGDPTVGETNASAATAAAMPVSDLKSQGSPATVRDGAELKSIAEPVTFSPFAGTASATDASAAPVLPASAEASDTAAVKTSSSDLAAAAGTATNLPVADFSATEFSAANKPGPESAAETVVNPPQPEVVSATDASAAPVMPAPTEASDTAAGKAPAGDFSSGSESAVAPAVHLPPPEAVSSGDSRAATLTPSPLKADGTPVAKLPIPMGKTEKMNIVAGLAGTMEKVLPDDGDLTALGNILPATDPSGHIFSHHGSDAVIIGLSVSGTEPVAASVPDSIPVSSLVDLRTRALERTHDMIAMQTVRLVDAKLDSLHVVIKPGAGLQLSLELRQHGGVIDAQAVLQRGDFGPLNQHWPELQQRLEQRGVQLAPLANGVNTAANFGGSGFQSSPHEFNPPDPLEASAFAEFALAGPAALSSIPALATAGIPNGWQTWA
jgi:hypothetical protein